MLTTVCVIRSFTMLSHNSYLHAESDLGVRFVLSNLYNWTKLS